MERVFPRRKFVLSLFWVLPCTDAEVIAQSKEGTSRLINPAAFNRIQSLLDKSQGQVVIGGEKDAGSNWMGVTVLSGVGLEDSLMTEYVCLSSA